LFTYVLIRGIVLIYAQALVSLVPIGRARGDALQNVLCKDRFDNNNTQHYKKYTTFVT